MTTTISNTTKDAISEQMAKLATMPDVEIKKADIEGTVAGVDVSVKYEQGATEIGVETPDASPSQDASSVQ